MPATLAGFTEQFDVRYPDGRPMPMGEWPTARAARGQAVRDCDLVLRRVPEGTPRLVRCSVVPVSDASAGPPLCVVHLVDRTAIVAAEEARQLSQTRFHDVFEHVITGIAITDSGGRFLECNPAFCRLLGYSLEELRGIVFSSVVHPDDIAENQRQMQRLQQGEISSFDIVNRYIRKDGSPIWVQKYISMLPDALGRPAYLVALVTDLTERRQAEEEARQREEGLQRFVRYAPVAIAMLDTEMRYIAASGRWLEDFRLEGRDLVGLSHYDIFPEIPDRWRTILRRCLAGATERAEEERFIRADGTEHWLRWEVHPWHVASGAIGGLMIFSEDITARKRFEVELERSHVVLQDRATELERRTLQLSQLASELTLAEQRAREQLAKTLHDHLQQLLFGATLKLERLAKRDVHRAPDDRSLLDRARADLDEAIAAARSLSVELFPPVLHDSGLPEALTWLAGWMERKYGLSVQLQVDASATCDRKDMRTLVFESVRELLFNAVKHAKVERVTLAAAACDDESLRITVADEGVGFDPAKALNPSAVRTGGLGLFSIRERLGLLGGQFEIDSAPGRGTRFILTVPRHGGLPLPGDLPQPEPSASTDTSPAAGTAPTSLPLRILIADDHAVVRDGLRELFHERRELRVIGEVATGAEAVEQARVLKPDLIVMDVSMPAMDGIEATRRIHAEFPSIKILGLSTQEQPDGLHAIERAGAIGYFSKGDESRLLIDRLLALHAEICQ